MMKLLILEGTREEFKTLLDRLASEAREEKKVKRKSKSKKRCLSRRS